MKTGYVLLGLLAVGLFVWFYSSGGFRLNADSGLPDVVDDNDSSVVGVWGISPCPLDYPDGDVPWYTAYYGCDDLGKMLEWKAEIELDGFAVAHGPYQSPEGQKCAYYMWVCSK